jgi:hypothetical protein
MRLASAVSKTAAFVTAALVVGSTPPAPVDAPLSGERISFATFSVGVPSGPGWKVAVESDDQREAVEFKLSRPAPLMEAGVGHSWVLTLWAFKIRLVRGDKPTPSEEVVAGKYLAAQERRERANVAQLPECEVKVLGTGTRTVAGKDVHFMSVTKSARHPTTRSLVGGAAMLYLHFPADFEKRGAFYGFRITQEGEGSPTLGAGDLSRLDDLVRSFEAR